MASPASQTTHGWAHFLLALGLCAGWSWHLDSHWRLRVQFSGPHLQPALDGCCKQGLWGNCQAGGYMAGGDKVTRG